MKHYLIEPTMKKSVIEVSVFTRLDENDNIMRLTREVGWRFGSFMVSVPETEEEAIEFVEAQGYDDILTWAIDFGYTYTNEDGEEALDEDLSVEELFYQSLVPSVEDDYVDITEDFPHADMIETWDGCWDDWAIYTRDDHLTEEQNDAMIEEIYEAYEEEYEEGVENLGWEFKDTYYEIHCPVTVSPCDEYGTVDDE